MGEGLDREMSLNILHEDMLELKTLVSKGFRDLLSPPWSAEVIHLLREANRLNEERLAQLDVTIREHALETQGILRAVVESQRQLVESQRQLVESQRELVDGQRKLAESQRELVDVQRLLLQDIRALIARIDALIKGRSDGSPTS